MDELEKMGYRFYLDGEKVIVRRYGSKEPPEGAAALLAKLDKEEVRRTLQDRAAGFSRVPDGVLFAFGDDIMPLARKIKAAMDNGELWDVRVVYSKSADKAEFHFLPPEWGEIT